MKMSRNRIKIYAVLFLMSLLGFFPLYLFKINSYHVACDDCEPVISEQTIYQYPAALRTTVKRMVLTGQIPKELDFSSPEDPHYQCSEKAVFSQTGGQYSTNKGCDVGGLAIYRLPLDLKEYRRFYSDSPKIVFTWGNKFGSAKVASLVYIVYPLIADSCEKQNRWWNHMKAGSIKNPLPKEPIPKLSVMPNLTPFNVPVPENEVVTLPPDRPFVCYEAPDGKFYYMHELLER